MSNSQQDNFSDPKTTYLIKLVNMKDTVAWCLSTGESFKAMQVLASLLASIEIEEAEQYTQLRELQQNVIFKYDSFMPTVQSTQVRIYYFMVSEYMNKTYFKDFKSFRFQNPKGGSFGNQYQ